METGRFEFAFDGRIMRQKSFSLMVFIECQKVKMLPRWWDIIGNGH